MSLFVATYRKHSIIAQKSRLNLRLMQLQQELLDKQQYAATIASGMFSYSDMANAPASMFGRLNQYMMDAQNFAAAGAEQKFSILMQTPGALPTFSTDEKGMVAQSQYMAAVQNQLFKNEVQEMAKIEAKQLNVEETKIQQEIQRIETQLKMLEADEKGIDELEDASAKKSVEYVA